MGRLTGMKALSILFVGLCVGLALSDGVGRRGGGGTTAAGSFSWGATSNTAGNDEALFGVAEDIKVLDESAELGEASSTNSASLAKPAAKVKPAAKQPALKAPLAAQAKSKEKKFKGQLNKVEKKNPVVTTVGKKSKKPAAKVAATTPATKAPSDNKAKLAQEYNENWASCKIMDDTCKSCAGKAFPTCKAKHGIACNYWWGADGSVAKPMCKKKDARKIVKQKILKSKLKKATLKLINGKNEKGVFPPEVLTRSELMKLGSKDRLQWCATVAKTPIAFAQKAVNTMNKILPGTAKMSKEKREQAATNALEALSLSRAMKMQTSETGEVPNSKLVYSQRSGVYAVRRNGFHVTFMCASWTAVCTVDAQNLPVSCSDHRKVLGCYKTRDITAKEWQGGKSQLAQMLSTNDKSNVLKFTSTDDNKAACGMAPNFA